jgi:hypothetical protein
MSSNIFVQRYVNGGSFLRYLPLFTSTNGLLTPPGRSPRPF